ncbi:MAG: YitT family protein, partial [Lachnospiraceae bacterium]|nr:YitT family protein [Lachnospiraceae bacterium]
GEGVITKKYGQIWIGTVFMALAVNFIYTPMNLVTGGVSGLGILLYHYFHIPIGLTSGLINLPLLVIGRKIKGGDFFKRTVFATISFTVMLWLIPVGPVRQNDMWMASILGGVLSGIGLGMVFCTDTSTGGSDLAATIWNHIDKRYRVANYLVIIDGTIVLVGAMVFGIYHALYAVVSVFLTSVIMDGILSGVQFGKAVLVFSDKNEGIAERIMKEKDRGVTLINGTGMYSKEEKPMLLCAVSRKEIIGVLDIINKIDKKAFVIVLDTKEIIGEGFVKNE